jgi:hypothetical protein
LIGAADLLLSAAGYAAFVGLVAPNDPEREYKVGTGSMEYVAIIFPSANVLQFCDICE